MSNLNQAKLKQTFSLLYSFWVFGFLYDSSLSVSVSISEFSLDSVLSGPPSDSSLTGKLIEVELAEYTFLYDVAGDVMDDELAFGIALL